MVHWYHKMYTIYLFNVNNRGLFYIILFYFILNLLIPRTSLPIINFIFNVFYVISNELLINEYELPNIFINKKITS